MQRNTRISPRLPEQGGAGTAGIARVVALRESLYDVLQGPGVASFPGIVPYIHVIHLPTLYTMILHLTGTITRSIYRCYEQHTCAFCTGTPKHSHQFCSVTLRQLLLLACMSNLHPRFQLWALPGMPPRLIGPACSCTLYRLSGYRTCGGPETLALQMDWAIIVACACVSAVRQSGDRCNECHRRELRT